ncbi:MAG: nucleotidyltransferase domain-containing protein [Clostridia bacterium]|nr:nucleotidyltransferase domain-containing protein [Clostridia bacterium]MDD4665833.1 nucleotidyltransferase domain-containing protein [Clostridia bacterium]
MNRVPVGLNYYLNEAGDYMDMQIRNELEKIKQTILHTVETEEIYLFGPYAEGIFSEDSDFDICVVIPDDSIRPLEAMQIIDRVLYQEQKKPINILVRRASDFQQRKLLSTLERTIAQEGVRLYG